LVVDEEGVGRARGNLGAAGEGVGAAELGDEDGGEGVDLDAGAEAAEACECDVRERVSLLLGLTGGLSSGKGEKKQ